MHKPPRMRMPNQVDNRSDEDNQGDWRQKKVVPGIEAGEIGVGLRLCFRHRFLLGKGKRRFGSGWGTGRVPVYHRTESVSAAAVTMASMVLVIPLASGMCPLQRTEKTSVWPFFVVA